MKRRLLSVMLVIILVLSCAPTALADSDTTPPELISVSVDKTELQPGETFILTLTIKEDESGLDCMNSMTGFPPFWNSGIHPTDMLGVYTVEFTVGEKCSTGDYTLGYVWLCDNQSNYQRYERADVQLLAECTVHVTNDDVQYDLSAPILNEVTISRNSAGVGDTIRIEVKADDPSGLYKGGVCLQLTPWMRTSVDLAPDPNRQNYLVGEFTVDSTTCSGRYVLMSVSLMDNALNYGYYTRMEDAVSDQSILPEAFCYLIDISNPNMMPTKNPIIIDSVQVLESTIKSGDPVTITVKINPNGNKVDDKLELEYGCAQWEKNAYISPVIVLTKTAEDTYTGSAIIPPNYPQTDYYLYRPSLKSYNNTGSWFIDAPESMYKHQTAFSIESVFSGTDNLSLPLGSPILEPLEGVTAFNNTEGNMFGKIEVSGSVDTSTPGVYLLKYKILSGYKDTVYQNKNFYYYESRWVGVTEIMPPSNAADAPLAVTNDSLSVGAQASDVAVKRNGSSVSYASNYTDPGVYAITENASAASSAFTLSISETSNGDASVQNAEVMSNGVAADSTVTAVIDRSGPALSATWQRNGASYNVSVQASDPSGVTQLLYKAGECSAADVRANGTAFGESFTVSSPGKYTVYAKDAFGYESTGVYTLTLPTPPTSPAPSITPAPSTSSTPTSYLYSIGVSGGTLSRSFSKTVYSYKIALGENQPSVTLTPVKEWDGAKMTINGKSVQSSTIAVANGKTVKATVKVTYGKTSKTYTFSITRAKSGNTNLLKLTASAGSFNTAFSAGVTNYTLTLDEKTASTTIKAAVENSSSKASPSSTKVKLKNGQSKTIKITVKAQSGAKKTYTVTVTRAKSTNTALKSLKTDSSKYPLSPAFKAGTASYTVTLPANKNKVTISAKTADSLTGVTVDGKKGSKKFTLANGQSITVKVVVTAQSGAKQEYTVTINRL